MLLYSDSLYTLCCYVFVGHYCLTGSPSPLRCENGTWTPDEGQYECRTCDAGEYDYLMDVIAEQFYLTVWRGNFYSVVNATMKG